MKFLGWIYTGLMKHYRKILVLLGSILIWTLIIFPFGDLSDYIGSRIYEATQKKLYLQFSNLQLSVFPPGLKFVNATVNTPSTGSLDAQDLSIYPSPMSLFGPIPSGSAEAHGLLKGNIAVSMKSGAKSEAGIERQKIEVTAEHLSLQDLSDITQLPIKMKGQLTAEGSGLLDLAFIEQPEATIVIRAEKFEMPSQTLNSYMGPLNIPDLKTSSLDLKGHMSAGYFFIDEAQIGKEGDDIHGVLKGKIGIKVKSDRMGPRAETSDYNFEYDFTIKSSLEDRLSLFLGILSQFKTSLGDSSKYKGSVNGQNFLSVPNLSH